MITLRRTDWIRITAILILLSEFTSILEPHKTHIHYNMSVSRMVTRNFLDFFLNNQPHTLIIQIYSVIKLYMFRDPLCPSSGVLYCIFGTGKFHAGF